MKADDIAAAPKPEPARDQWGRYLIPVPGKATVPHTRATTITKILSDTYGLDLWKQRMVAHGIGQREDLHALAATLNPDDDKKALNRVCSDAMAAAQSAAGANRGTALHKACDIVDLGGECPPLPSGLNERIQLYQTTVARAGLKFAAEHIEQIVTIPDWNGDGSAPPIAGTADRGVCELPDGRRVISDLKTARTVDYSWGEISQQLAIYANHDHTYDAATNKLGPPMEGVDRDVALVIWLPSTGPARCVLYLVDIKAGFEAVDYALWTYNWRKRKGLADEYRPVKLDDSLPAGAAAPTTWIRDRIRALGGRRDAAGMLVGLWPESVPKPLPDVLSDAQVEGMAAVLDEVEARYEIPFGASRPGAVMSRPKPKAT